MKSRSLARARTSRGAEAASTGSVVELPDCTGLGFNSEIPHRSDARHTAASRRSGKIRRTVSAGGRVDVVPLQPPTPLRVHRVRMWTGVHEPVPVQRTAAQEPAFVTDLRPHRRLSRMDGAARLWQPQLHSVRRTPRTVATATATDRHRTPARSPPPRSRRSHGPAQRSPPAATPPAADPAMAAADSDLRRRARPKSGRSSGAPSMSRSRRAVTGCPRFASGHRRRWPGPPLPQRSGPPRWQSVNAVARAPDAGTDLGRRDRGDGLTCGMLRSWDGR